MRSYEAARTLFNFLAFCAWTVFAFGVLIALAGAGSGSRFGGAGAGLLAMGPGFAICIIALLLVAFVQMGRANVDTAEYTQQILAISRDQLGVSKQSLKQGGANPKDYSSLSKETKDSAQNTESILNNAQQGEAAPNHEVPISNYGKKVSYNGHAIIEANGIFHVEDAEFRQIEHAEAHIDMLSEKNEMMIKVAELSAVVTPKPEPISNRLNPASNASEVLGYAQEPNVNLVEYNGKQIEQSGGKFICNGIPFSTLNAAKNYVDNFVSTPPKALPGAK